MAAECADVSSFLVIPSEVVASEEFFISFSLFGVNILLAWDSNTDSPVGQNIYLDVAGTQVLCRFCKLVCNTSVLGCNLLWRYLLALKEIAELLGSDNQLTDLFQAFSTLFGACDNANVSICVVEYFDENIVFVHRHHVSQSLVLELAETDHLPQIRVIWLAFACGKGEVSIGQLGCGILRDVGASVHFLVRFSPCIYRGIHSCVHFRVRFCVRFDGVGSGDVALRLSAGDLIQFWRGFRSRFPCSAQVWFEGLPQISGFLPHTLHKIGKTHNTFFDINGRDLRCNHSSFGVDAHGGAAHSFAETRKSVIQLCVQLCELLV